MKFRYKTLIQATVGLSSLCMGHSAFAAEADAPEPVANEAIIVTARRFEERLQDVPISISVVDQSRLATANITSSEDLSKVVPGLNVQSRYSPENANFSIRGFSQELRTSASVGTYFADVVAPRGGGVSLQGGDGAGPGTLFDLQNVQVLKGPQGTLFGRNTTGGAVLLVPRKPTDNFEGYLEGSYGNYDMFRIQGVVNLPLTSFARLRVGVDRQTRDGFLHNVSPIGPKDFGNIDYTATRASLALDLAPTLDNLTIASYTRSRNNGSIPQISRTNPASFYGRLLAPQLAARLASGDPYQVAQKLANPESSVKQFQIINTTTWAATDNLTIKNIFSYSHLRQRLRQDIFSGYIPLSALQLALPPANYAGIAGVVPADAMVLTSYSFSPSGGWTNNQKNVTEELQFQGSAAEGQLQYQFGLYYEHSTPGADTASMSPGVGSICSPAAFSGPEDFRCSRVGVTSTGRSQFNYTTGSLEYINMAAYGQATYAVTDQLKLTGGARFTYDRTRGQSRGLLYGFSGNFPGGYGNATLLGCQPDYPTATDCTVGSDVLRSSSKKPTWTFNAAYSPTNMTMVYGSYSRGYRQGSSVPFAVGGNTSFAPETVDAFEVGLKQSFSGSISGYFNLAAFYSKLKNQQLQIGLLDSGTGRSATSIFNAGASRIYGADVDGSIKFTDWFRVTGSATYVNSKVKSIDISALAGILANASYDVIQPSAGVGDELPFTPKWSVNISPTLSFPVGSDNGTVELIGTYRYASSFSTEASATSDARASSVSQLDLNLGWNNVAGAPIDISAFATNVTKQVTYTLNQTLFTSFGFNQRYLGQPRVYGLRLKVRFGEGISN